LVQYSVL